MSAAPETPIPLSAIREALRRYEAASSERAAAAAVKMSQRGLRKFLSGEVKPQAATVKKLTTWYLKHSEGAHLDAETAEAAIGLLLAGFPVAERGRVRERLLDVLRQGHRTAGTDPPEWLKEDG